MDAATGLFLILFGCSDDMALCERITVAPKVYASASSCQMQHAIALRSPEASSADYPNVVALCVTGRQLAFFGSRPVNLSKPLT